MKWKVLSILLLYSLCAGISGAEEVTKEANVTTENKKYDYLFKDAKVVYTDKDTDTDTDTDTVYKQVTEVNAYFNAPYLIQFTDNVFVGGYAERNVNQTNSKEKPAYGIGITYRKTAFDLRGIWPWSKKEN